MGLITAGGRRSDWRRVRRQRVRNPFHLVMVLAILLTGSVAVAQARSRAYQVDYARRARAGTWSTVDTLQYERQPAA